MTTLLAVAVLIGAAVVAVVFIATFLMIRNNFKRSQNDQGLAMLQAQINEISRAVDNKLGESAKMMQNQFAQSTRLIKEITQELTSVKEGHKQVMSVTEQLKTLQDILKNPKQRGVLGEYYLETVLKNVLPPGSYEMQYAFSDGDIVDAVVKVKDKIIPIDSKFSLENYNRILETNDPIERKRLEEALRNDLKTRIDETAKYIKPNEGTTEFAFMFIPAEAVYYDLLINKIGAVKANTRDLIEYAIGEKKVIIVSPTSFLAYLQTVLQGLKAMQIEESAKEIKKRVETLGRHLLNYEAYMKKMGTHLSTVVNTYNSAYKEFGKIDKDILRITEKSPGLNPASIAKPDAGE